MNRTAAEVQSSLRKKLIRQASEHPETRARIFPILRKMGVAVPVTVGAEAVAKQAKAGQKEFGDFVATFHPVPMSPNEVEAFINVALKIKTSPPVGGGPKGPRYKKGDLVEICADKHKEPATLGPYKEFDKKTGIVEEVDGMDVLVKIRGESDAAVRFPNGMKPRGVGIYKFTPAYTVTGSPSFEMYYEASGEAGESVEATAYLGRSKGTAKRDLQYYTGSVVLASTGERGFYFRGFPQQRMRVEGGSSCSGEGGYRPTTWNPSVGKVFYMGLLGKRPGGWEEKLAAAKEDSGVEV